MSAIINHVIESRGAGMPPKRIPVVLCNCGDIVECWDSWANECDKCGTEYNGSGQELAPRNQWGWETGETFAPGESY